MYQTNGKFSGTAGGFVTKFNGVAPFWLKEARKQYEVLERISDAAKLNEWVAKTSARLTAEHYGDGGLSGADIEQYLTQGQFSADEKEALEQHHVEDAQEAVQRNDPTAAIQSLVDLESIEHTGKAQAAPPKGKDAGQKFAASLSKQQAQTLLSHKLGSGMQAQDALRTATQYLKNPDGSAGDGFHVVNGIAITALQNGLYFKLQNAATGEEYTQDDALDYTRKNH